MSEAVEEAHAVVENLVRQRLSSSPLPQGAEAEAERVVHLGIVSSFENSFRRALEEAVSTLKTIKGPRRRRGCGGG